MTARRASRTNEPRASTRPGGARRPWIAARHHRRLHVAVFVLGVLVCGLGSLLLGKDNNWDLQNYHCYNAYAFLNDRIGFDVAPAQRQSYLNPVADVPFYLGSNYLQPQVFGFLMGGIHGLAFGLLFGTCFVVFRHLGPNLRVALSALCAGLGAYAPVFVGELGASQNDTLVGLLVLASVWLLARTLAQSGTLAGREQRRSLALASLILGLGVGLKLTMMLHAVAVAAAILVVESTWTSRARVIATLSVMFLAGFLITNGYWMARLWYEFDNPFFPFYNNIFKSGWAESRSYADLSMVPRNPPAALTFPFLFALDNKYTYYQSGFRDVRYAVLYVLVALLAAQWIVHRVAGWLKFTVSTPRVPAEIRFLFVFFVVSFVVWEASFSIIRYTACLEALAPLLIVIAICTLWRSTVVRVVLIATTFGLTAGLMRPIQQQRIPWGKAFWQVLVPAIVDPQDALIIIANSRPLSYLVPRFSPEIRWVGLKNNLTDPRRPTRMQEAIHRIIDTHKGEMYLVTRAQPDAWLRHDVKVLTYYHLTLADEVSRPVLSRHSPTGIRLLRLRRSDVKTPPPAPE